MQVDGCLDCFCNVGLYDAIFYESPPLTAPSLNLGKRSLRFLRHDIIWVWCRFCSQQKSPSYQANLLYNWVPFIFSSERQEYHSLFSTKSICWKSSPESGLKFAAIHIFISFQSFVYLKGKWQNWNETQQQQPDWGFGPTMTWSRWGSGVCLKQKKLWNFAVYFHFQYIINTTISSAEIQSVK